jgi:hypothetical protein
LPGYPGYEAFRRLSKGASLIACYVNETVMNSYAQEWVNGVERWSVFHDLNQGTKHLETSGSLPVEIQPIRDRCFSRQDEAEGGKVDYIFDIPIDLFVALGGIRYDMDISGAGAEPWEILDVPPPTSWTSSLVNLWKRRG